MTTERLLTPSKITAWLDCAHSLTLRHQVDDGTLVVDRLGFGPFAQLLADKGLEHEQACLDHYRSTRRTLFEVPAREQRESFAAWVASVGNPLADGHEVIHQMPFIHRGVRGIADFLIRVDDAETGEHWYEPVDAKLARTEAKPGHVLQLCFYADALESITGHAPREIHLWLGSGEMEDIRTEDVRPYWNRLRGQLDQMIATEVTDYSTHPEPCTHCEFCEFAAHCEAQWRAEDSLVFVANLRSQDRAVLKTAGVDTLELLAKSSPPIDGLQPSRVERVIEQASLQLEARERHDSTLAPPFRLTTPGADPALGHGFEQLPAPDDGDIFLDYEGHPFWRADAGLFFLFGYLAQDEAGAWEYTQRWAHDQAEEAAETHHLIDYIARRREAHPGMHVYHYNHTERSQLERLASVHGTGEAKVAELVDTGCFVDLYVVARNAMQVGTESYGLKSLELLAGFIRGDDIHQGSGAVVEYDAYMTDHDPTRLERIAAYNRDDVLATRALRDWLLLQRPSDLPWREPVHEAEQGPEGLDERVEALMAYGSDTPEHLLGDVLGYWLREWRAYIGPKVARLFNDDGSLVDDTDFIADLVPIGLVDRIGTAGNVLEGSAMQFRFPTQPIDPELGDAKKGVIYVAPDEGFAYGSIQKLDRDEGLVDLKWDDQATESGVFPTSIVVHDFVHGTPKALAVDHLAARVLGQTPGDPSRVAMALLRRDLPAFNSGQGPNGGRFDDDVATIAALAVHLDHSYLAVQGPPGTGKTYSGAHIIRALLEAELRVGITAFSHSAIDNLMKAAVEHLEEVGELGRLRALQVVRADHPRTLEPVKYMTGNKRAGDTDFNLVAGTTWLFSSEQARSAPVDVLLIDEAGQLSLADAVATTGAATSLVLLGDPLQLAQVSKARHPRGSGRSVLEHVLGDHETMPVERGAFLSVTRRMHPDICSFISERVYDGRLTSHPSCAQQCTEFGTGLRWIPAEHTGRTTESVEEAEVIAREIARLMGTEWTNQRGETGPLGPDDFMVVAPYNHQVRCLRRLLDAHPETRDVPVGTVDKFQGREAEVVFFTMTASSSADIPRGTEFLFSQNRLNVAISRARCLAYLVCTDELLNSRARDLAEMKLISTLCAFVDQAQRVSDS